MPPHLFRFADSLLEAGHGRVNPPSVCIIVENLSVPLDRRVWQEARTLREAGYSVSIISPKGGGFRRSRETLEGVEIYRHRIWEASGPGGYFIEYAWALAVEFCLALSIYARTRFRILHACNPPDTIFLIALFFKLFGVRFIFDHHDLNPELYEAKFGRRDWGYRLLCWAERRTFGAADVSIATNESFREIALVRGGMPPERVFVVRSCPDLAAVSKGPPQANLKEGRRHLVVYLGVMGSQDGVDLLLESIAILLARRRARKQAQPVTPDSGDSADVLFALLGSGTELPKLKKLAAQKQLEHSVRFTGFANSVQLAAYLSTADVGVAPDPATPMNDKSTMNKILEYMAYGVPVVLYDLTEGRRSAGNAALYAKPNDPEDFARQIEILLDSPELRQRLGACGRKRIEESLNWATEKKALLEAYATALAR